MMDGQIREIPGYYYDRGKNKYFKIQASSTAPASSAYSSQDVKRRKLQDERSEAVAFGIAQQRGRIQRARILQEPVMGGFLAREQGHLRLDASQIFAAGLYEHGSVQAPIDYPSSGIFFDIDPHIGSSVIDMRIGKSPITVYLLPQPFCEPDYMSSRNITKWHQHYVNADHSNPCILSHIYSVNSYIVVQQFYTAQAVIDDTTYRNDHLNTNSFHGLTVDELSWTFDYFEDVGEFTSLCVNRVCLSLAMTWLASSLHTGIAIVPMDSTALSETPVRPDIVLGPGMSRGREVSMYSSTPAPPESSILFAFGSSHGIMTVDKRDYDTHFISPKPVPEERYPSDVFALEFLADNHSVLLSGGRRGILNITDLRIPKFGSDADTISHPSTITHIKQLDAHRIIVSGLNSTLCQYDLRFRKVDAPPPPAPLGRKYRSIYNATPTRPILEYTGFHNTATIQHGFDVDLETGVVAAAQEHDAFVRPPVQLFSLHGGQMLRSPRLEKFDDLYTDQVVPCLRFVEDCENRAKSLYIGANGIYRYAWIGDDDSDP